MPTLRDTYRQGLSALLADADRLGSTPDDIAARVVVLAELRHAIAAGLGEEAPDKGAPWLAVAHTTGTPVTDGPMSWGSLTELRERAFDTSRAVPVEQPKPSKGRLVWVDDDWQDYLVPPDHNTGSAVCVVCNGWVAHYPGGRGDYDKTETCLDRATALRTAAELARADGYECDEHPDAAPAIADAPTLPPGLTAEDGWIAWGGGECPCRDWPEVEYVMRGGVLSPYVDEPGDLNWWRTDTWIDIIAYRRPR